MKPPLKRSSGGADAEDGAKEQRSVDLSTMAEAKTSSGGDDSAGRFMGKLPVQNKELNDEEGVGDMAALSKLNEPSILYNLRARFFAGIPYTYTADIVIAVNPYQWLHELYTEEIRKEYLIFVDRGRLKPHVYSTSARAYHGMKDFGKNQSVLVSGESGAGKTETVKILMGHLAFMSTGDDKTVIRRVLESNPLLESFGNAKTVRNDNSSRFGKFIELQFRRGQGAASLVGSRSKTYLLEKTRVAAQASGERGFHIFYQLLAAPAMVTERALVAKTGGGKLEVLDFRFLEGGGAESITTSIEGLSDAQRFDSTVRVLNLLNMDASERNRAWELLGGILHLGQFVFAPPPGGDADEGSQLKPDDTRSGVAASLPAVAKLLGLNNSNNGGGEAVLRQGLLERTMSVAGETHQIKQRPHEAKSARDGLAKELYARLFDWLVARINRSTEFVAQDDSVRTVGLLDIFGFESFAVNRFEQFCINYANEKLQQKFTHDVLKSVQNEYDAEGIQWQHIDFADNQPVLDLIESRMGIISILNEECMRPRGSDSALCSKLLTSQGKHPAFLASKFNTANGSEFGVRHYAGSVTYQVDEFLTKNKDTLVDNLVQLMATSEQALVKELFAPKPPEAPTEASAKGAGGGGGKGKAARRGSSLAQATVTTQFKRQLAAFMEQVGMTAVQYVRCVKPNTKKSQHIFELSMVVEQLRCAGVLEAIRISRTGFPNHVTHGDFVSRFWLLAPSLKSIRGDKKVACTELISLLCPGLTEKGTVQVGKTKAFFGHGVLEQLEDDRNTQLNSRAIKLQARYRGYRAVSHLRRCVRAATTIQAKALGSAARKRFGRTRRSVLAVQLLARSRIARKRVEALRRVRAATVIESAARMWRWSGHVQKTRAAATAIQSLARMCIRQRRYKQELVRFVSSPLSLHVLGCDDAYIVVVVVVVVVGVVALFFFCLLVQVEYREQKDMTAQMRKQISTLESSQQELFLKNERTMEELRKSNAALKVENDALKRAKESFLEDIFHLTMSNKVLMENQGSGGGGGGNEWKLRERIQHLKEEIEAKGVLLGQQFEIGIKMQQLLSRSVELAREHSASPELIEILSLNAKAASDAGQSMEALEAELGRKKSAQRSWSEAAKASMTTFKGWLG